jgi:RHS repeat-associated protein
MLREELSGGPGDHPLIVFLSGGEPEHRMGLPNYWINTAALTLVVIDRLYGYKGLGPGVEFVQTYNSYPGSGGMFGPGWSFSYESSIDERDGTLYLIKGSGKQVRYRPGTGGNPVEASPLSGTFDRLLDYGTHWIAIPKQSRLLYRYDKRPDKKTALLTSIADFDGNEVQIRYNAGDRITSITDAAGRETAFTYGQAGLCTGIRLPDGRSSQYDYDSRGTLVRATDLQGITAEYGYESDGSFVRMVVGEDRKTTLFSYRKGSPAPAISSVTNAAGNTTVYERISSGEVKVIDPEGGETRYQSSGGRTEAIVDPLGKRVEFEYKNGQRFTYNNKNGRVTRMEYDRRANLTGVLDALGNRTRYSYDDYDNLLSQTDAEGGVVAYTYDDRHHLVRLTTPSGSGVAWEYDSRGLITATSDPAGRSTVEYDKYGNPATVTDPLGNRGTFRYDEAGLRLLELIHPEGKKYSYEYDQNDRLIALTHPDGATTRHSYGCCAGISTTDENGNKYAFTRNALLAVTQESDPLGNVTRYGYDRKNNPVSITDPLGREMRLSHDRRGQVTELTDGGGGAVAMRYDGEGNIVSLSDKRGNSLSFEYDELNRRIAITDPLDKKVRFLRNVLGWVTSLTNARGGIISFGYDKDGRVTMKSYNGKRAVDFGYTKSGNPERVVDATGTTAYSYNAAKQITSIHYPDNTEVGFTYDANGNRQSVRYPGGLEVTYRYDACDRVVEVAWGQHSYSCTYDAAGNVTMERRSNKTESRYTYDALSRFTRIEHALADGPLADIGYAYDAVGNITRESGIFPCAESIKSSVQKNEPVSASYNKANQIQAWNSDRFSYDADGNRTGIEGKRSFRAVYDPENRPTEMTIGDRKITITYNGSGDRVRVVRDGVVRNYHYTPEGALLFETDENGETTWLYIFCEGRIIARMNRAGDVSFYHFDKTGNTLALTNGGGSVSASYGYDVFGAVIGREGTPDDNPFSYAGEFGVMDDGSDLYFMRHRYYDAQTGTFLQKDPIGHYGGLNLYAYVDNNPVITVDPEGTGFGIAIAIAAALIGIATTGIAAHKFGTKNPITRVLKVSQQGNAKLNKQALGPNPKQEFFNDPDHGMGQVMTTAGDKGLTHNPVTAVPWSLGKGLKSAAEGKPVDAAINWSGAIPSVSVITGPGKSLSEVHQITKIPIGGPATLLGEVKSICESPGGK